MRLLPLALVLIGVSVPVFAVDAGLEALEEVNSASVALSHKDNARAITLAKKGLAALEAHPAKPEKLSEADWEKDKALAITSAHWVAGIAEGLKNSFFDADKDLRAALPGTQEPERKAAALFYLGLADYQIGRQTFDKQKILQAAKFSEECSQIKSQYQVQAYNNAKAMKQEAGASR